MPRHSTRARIDRNGEFIDPLTLTPQELENWSDAGRRVAEQARAFNAGLESMRAALARYTPAPLPEEPAPAWAVSAASRVAIFLNGPLEGQRHALRYEDWRCFRIRVEGRIVHPRRRRVAQKTLGWYEFAMLDYVPARPGPDLEQPEDGAHWYELTRDSLKAWQAQEEREAR